MIRHLLALGLLLYCAANGASNEECDVGQVRLVGGRNVFEGVLEVCLEVEAGGVLVFRWQHLCGSPWSAYEAQVVCRELGYGEEGVVGENNTYPLVSSSDIYQTTFYCNGDEKSITLCPVILSECDFMSETAAPATVRCTVDSEEDQNLETESSATAISQSSVSPSTTKMFLSTMQTETTSASILPTNVLTVMTTSTQSISEALQTTQQLLTTSTIPVSPSSTTLLTTMEVTTTISASDGDLQLNTAERLTPIEYALLFCTILAAVLFVIIVTLVAIAIWLARMRGNKQKHRRVHDASVYYDHHLSVEGEDDAEHNVDNPLYTDPNFRTMPRSTHINIYHQFERDVVENNYETISDMPRRNRGQSRETQDFQRQDDTQSGLAREIQQLRTNEQDPEDNEYSHLNTNEIDYATLEPHIQQPRTHEAQRMEESDELDYSHLVH